MVGWAHSRFGRLDGLDLETPIGGVAREAIGQGARLLAEGVVTAGGSAVASCVSILERGR